MSHKMGTHESMAGRRWFKAVSGNARCRVKPADLAEIGD